MPWIPVIAAGVGAAGSLIGANQQKKATQGVANAYDKAQLDPNVVGQQSLQAQAGLAPSTINLNSIWGGQFANANNAALANSLFGANAIQAPMSLESLQKDQGFASLNPDVQKYLASQVQSNGFDAIRNTFNAEKPVDNILNLYRGMTGQDVGSDDQNEAFNEWNRQHGFAGWENPGENPVVDNFANWTRNAKAPASPGILDMVGQADAKLNPAYADALSKLGAAAGIAPATITPQTLGQSPFVNQLAGLLGNGAPQVRAGSGNAGMDALQRMLGQSGFQAVNAAQAGPASGPNLMGAPAQSTMPNMGNVALAQGAQSGPAAMASGDHLLIQAPTSFERINSTGVQAPNSFLSVNAPGAVGNIGSQNVSAWTGFDRVNAPNVNLQQVGGGQNQILSSLANQGFDANRPIQQTLESQALSDLQMGNQLSPDQVRMAQQASRAGFGARGMLGSDASIVDEVQRQLDRSNQLQNERRGFASAVENQGFGQLATQKQNQLAAAGLQNAFLGLGQEAQQANNQNALALGQMGLNAGLANQNAQLQGNQLNLQGQLANQSAALDAARANQSTQLAQTNQQLQAALANQGANQALQQLGQQAGLANQANAFNAAAANQDAGLRLGQMGLQAGMANQSNLLQNAQFNAGSQNALNQFNAQLAQNTGQFNAGAQNDWARMLGQMGLQNNQFNAGILNNAAQFNAGQQDAAAARAQQIALQNAQFQQQGALANQNAFQNDFAQRLAAAGQLGGLGNEQLAQALQGQIANQGSWLQNQGQNINAWQALLAQDNARNQFNVANDLAAQQFNAGQGQQGFANLLAYQQAAAQGRFDPMAALGFANGQANWGMFDPFNPTIMAMYAGNAQNAANAQIGRINSNAAANSGLIQGLGNAAIGIINAYGNKNG